MQAIVIGRKLARRGWFGGAAAGLVGFLALAGAQPARATLYTLANRDDAVVGQDKTVVTVYEDTLYDLARKFSLGSEELIRVNPGVDPWLPGAGKTLVGIRGVGDVRFARLGHVPGDAFPGLDDEGLPRPDGASPLARA